MQYMTGSIQGKKSEKERRYLALNYGDEDADADTTKQISEEEWLTNECKEIEEVEKTVNIRFANYTTLMRA